MTKDDEWVPFYHTRGEAACGGVAFEWLNPEPYGVVTASRARFPSGREVVPNMLMVCDACGHHIGGTSVTRSDVL